MKVLRDALRREAGWIWNQKARAEALGLFLNEETITETILLHLAAQFHGGNLIVSPFTKAEETKNGADWEFWFVQGKRAVGLRVQAKRLFPAGNYTSWRPSGAQTKKLIANSADCFPIFAFYNDAKAFSPVSPICSCENYKAPSYRGCVLVPAGVAQSFKKNDALTIAKNAIPWHCLLCDQPAKKASAIGLPQMIADNINHQFDLPGEDKCKVQTDFVEILALAEVARSDKPNLQWLEVYLGKRRLAGLTLIQTQD
jgi:hypothetical protein